MTHKYLLGIDLGTSATKAALYRSDGTLVASASQEVPLYYPSPGVVEQKTEDFYTTAAATIRHCIQESGIDPRHVAGMAFDSQMAGIGAVDEDFNPAIRFDSWLDMRCQPYIEWMDRKAGDLVTRLTGCPPTCAHGPKMLWWQHEHPQDFERIARFVTPSGYVAGRVCGLRGDQAFIDHTFIHFSGFSDSARGVWSPELCQRLGLDASKLPRIVESWQQVGELTPKAAADLSLSPGTPVAAGAGDTAASALGAGIVQPGMLFDVAGTAAVLAACTDSFVADEKQRALLTMRSIIPGLWHPLAYIAGGGLALRWFRDHFYNTNRADPLPVDENLYTRMSELAAGIAPGADGLLFSPHLGGRICPSAPGVRGAWMGFSWGHTQAHFLRALLESVALEYAWYLLILRQSLPWLELASARVIGGGARSLLWNSIKADALGVPYQRLKGDEFGTWGAAMIAGKAAGVYNDLATIALEHSFPEGKPQLPDPVNTDIYARILDRYLTMQGMLEDFYAVDNGSN